MKTPEPDLRVVDVTVENFNDLPCCGIKNLNHIGRHEKAVWFREQARLGLRAKALITPAGASIGLIEYIPGEHAWRGVNASGYMFIHCIWVHSREYEHRGGARRLLQACIADAQKSRSVGVAVLTRQSPWMADRRVFIKNGFELVESAPPDYELLVRKFNPNAPNSSIRKPNGISARAGKGLTIVHASQCPYATKFTEEIAECARREYNLKPRLIQIESANEAQHAPTAYATFAILYDGRILTDHQISRTRFRNIMQMVSIPVASPSKSKKSEA